MYPLLPHSLQHEAALPAAVPKSYTILVPVFDDFEIAAWATEVALSLVRSRPGRVVLVGMVRVPAAESLSTAVDEVRQRRASLHRLREQFDGEPLEIKPRVRVEHEPWRKLVRLVQEEQADVAVLPWHYEASKPFYTLGMDEMISRLLCHVVVLHGRPVAPRQLLLPLRGSVETPLALEVALAVAGANGGQITRLYANRDDDAPQSQRIHDETARISQGSYWMAREVRVRGEAVPEIRRAADQHDLIVMGASEDGAGGAARSMGLTARTLRRDGRTPMIIVKTHRPPPLGNLAIWQSTEPLSATPTSVVVDKWFAENTFTSQEFEDVERLVALKEAQGLTISLGLPALNEEKTVGRVIETVRSALMEAFPLLDEIVLIDSGSTDATVAIASELGIPVYQHSEILPELGSHQGKGEALWKSLHVLKGDLIAWIDTDIVNIHPRFVWGVLGPLLQRPMIQYVKGFYRRPLRVGDTLQAGGGGRVTELVARPLINLFYPELSGIVQPLSGEYAGRRSALERAPFYTGYGVEMGLLLELVEQFGISAIAQVDLLDRIHHNQPLPALSRMSFAIIQVLIEYLEQRQDAELLTEMNRTMKIIRYEASRYSLEEQAISDKQRPAMISLPAYRARHQPCRETSDVGGRSPGLALLS